MAYEDDSSKAASLIDVHVGQQIRRHRREAKMSAEQLSSTLGVSVQQLQKYEAGVSRVRAGTLALAARALGVPVEAFFAETESGAEVTSPGAADT